MLVWLRGGGGDIVVTVVCGDSGVVAEQKSVTMHKAASL